MVSLRGAEKVKFCVGYGVGLVWFILIQFRFGLVILDWVGLGEVRLCEVT